MNLLAAKGGGRKRATGDTNEMVQARRRFLDKEHYADAAETVAETVARHLASRARERKNGEDRERNASEEECNQVLAGTRSLMARGQKHFLGRQHQIMKHRIG